MVFGRVLEETIKQSGETKIQAADKQHVDNSTLGKYVSGKRKAPRDFMKRSTEHYDEPKLYVAAIEEAAGGAGVPWLDKVDLHKATVHLKTLEEIKEAIDAMQYMPITKRKDQLTEEDLRNIKNVLKESVEAITALTHYVAVLCKEYCFSWMTVWKEHRKELKAKNYLS